MQELVHGTLPLEGFKRYLIQEFAFVETAAAMTAYAIARAPDMADKARLARALSELTTTPPIYSEWIAIHTSPAFVDYVDWLRPRVDALAISADRAHHLNLHSLFKKTLQHGIVFHDAASAERPPP